MTPYVKRPSVLTGVVIFALLALADLLSPWLFPAPPDAPAIADVLTVVFGVLGLVVLAAWLVTSARWAMWVGVVIRVIGALFGILGVTDPTVGTAFVVETVVYLVLTIVGIVLVVPTLRAGSRSEGGAAVGV
jgi:hypothetical protein